MTYLTVPFFTYIFAVAPVWPPLLLVDLIALYLLIFKERLDPRTLIFWVAVVFILPFLGFLLYLVFGCTLPVRGRGERKHSSDGSFLVGSSDEVPESDARMTDILSRSGADVYTGGNRVRLDWQVPARYDEYLDDLSEAKESVHIETNRLPDDGGRLVDALCRIASRGIDVKVLTGTLWFGRTDGLRKLRAAGVRHATFHGKILSAFSIRAASRCLREVHVVDGRIAYTGMGSYVRIEGSAAGRLERRFLADWGHSTGEGAELRDAPRSDGDCGVQVVTSGPDAPDMPMLHGYSELISEARDRLYVTFPFLIPNDEMYNAIKQAVIAGTDVRILIPSVGSHWYQPWNSLAAANPLMMAGARVYFSRTASVRCLAVADGRVCALGSGVYNSRSLWADYGVNVVMHSEEVAREAEEAFLEELGRAAECLPEEYERRSFGDRLKIAVSRMLMFFN